VAWTAGTFAAQGGVDLSNLRLVLPKRGSVRGKITDSAGNPVDDAVISAFITLPEGAAPDEIRFLFPCEPLLKATSGADGVFVLDGLPANATVMLRVTHPDFAIAVAGAPEDIRGMPMGTIAVGATDAAVQLEPGAVIEGTVTLEETGDPARGAAVQASPVREQFSTVLITPKAAETNPDGRYVLRGLAAGQYAVSVTHPGGTMLPITIDVATGERLTAQNIALGKGVLVSGKFVYAETGKPVPDGRLMAIRTDVTGPSRQTPVEVKPDGTFSFRGPPGDIRLYGYTAAGAHAQRELTLVAGKDLADVALEIPPALMFKGKVVGPDGKGVEGAWVASKRGGRERGGVRTAADGTFELPLGGQRPGEYEWLLLDAHHPDMPGYRGIVMKPFADESDAEGVIELQRTATIRGRVVTEDDNPIPSASVRTTIFSENYGWSDVSATTDNSGLYELADIASGMDYRVTATADGFGQDNSEHFTLDPGEMRELRDLVLLVADQTIEGTVVDEDGNPVAGAQVNAHSRATGSRHTTTDEKGHFRLNNLVDEGVQIWAYQHRAAGPLQAQASAVAGDTDVEIVLAEQPGRMSPQQREAQLLVNKRAAELDVAEWVKGEPTTLESLRGKTVVLAFWDSADQKCADIVPVLNGVAMTSYTPDVEVVSVHAADAQAGKLKQYTADKSITFHVALDKPAERYKGATFERYQTRRLPAIYVIDVAGIVRYQDIPLAAIEEAVKNVPTDIDAQADPAPAAREPLPVGGDRARRACANNLKQLGLVCKMYANEWNGKFPPIDDRRGNLAMEGNAIFPEYLTDLNVLICPGNEDHGPVPRPGTRDDVTDESYFYLGWALMTEQEGLALLEVYDSLDPAQRDEDLRVAEGKGNAGGNTIYRLREGIERFFITDINNPAASAVAQSQIPVMWDRPTNHQDPPGGNVLYMDGHVEFLKYPSKFPMTPAFIKRCEEISVRNY